MPRTKARSESGCAAPLGFLEAGVLGALAMLACLMIGSLGTTGPSGWCRISLPPLFSGQCVSKPAAADHVVRGGAGGGGLRCLGILWGCIWRDERKPWLALYGAILGLAVYFVFYDFMWKHANPLVVLYAPDRQLQLGHVLWGMILARAPGYSRRIAEASGTAPHHDSEVEEIRSGEVTR